MACTQRCIRLRRNGINKYVTLSPPTFSFKLCLRYLHMSYDKSKIYELDCESGIMKLEKHLGFGFMRLAKSGDKIDLTKTCELVDCFMQNGYSYFDTAYMYNGSEDALRQALVERYPREKYQVATKLPLYQIDDNHSMQSIFEESLKRLGVTYIDVYLLHGIDKFWSDKAAEMGAWEYLRDLRSSQKVKYIGFSFHGTPEDLDSILASHSEIDVVQLQINYIDWNDPKIQSKKLYEIARKHNKPVIVMEPVKGGLLANENIQSGKHLKSFNSKESVASWAMRFVASLDNVCMVLSGMNELKQIKDNIRTFQEQRPFSETEQAVLQEAINIIQKTPRIPCTECGYCTNKCAKGIKIPILLSLYNDYTTFNSIDNFKHMYDMYTEDGTRANTCIKCHLCEEICPQKIDITEVISKVSAMLDYC